MSDEKKRIDKNHEFEIFGTGSGFKKTNISLKILNNKCFKCFDNYVKH